MGGGAPFSGGAGNGKRGENPPDEIPDDKTQMELASQITYHAQPSRSFSISYLMTECLLLICIFCFLMQLTRGHNAPTTKASAEKPHCLGVSCNAIPNQN